LTMSTQPIAAILPVTCAQATEYFNLFANRRAYVRQSHSPNKESGRFYYYKMCDRLTKQALSIDIPAIQGHLAGHITIGLYAISPQSQSTKWIAIDADYADARRDLLRLQQELFEDGIESLMEQSRRGCHLWTFLAEPLPAKLCRLYVLNVARRRSNGTDRTASKYFRARTNFNPVPMGTQSAARLGSIAPVCNATGSRPPSPP